MEIIRIVADISQVVIAIVAVVLANQENFSRWRGLKNLSGSLRFEVWDFLVENKTRFELNIKNKGFVAQKIKCVVNHKKDSIYLFKEKLSVPPRDQVEVLWEITEDQLDILKNSEGLFLSDNLHNKQKILSKKDIQEVLKEYEKHVKQK